MRPWSHSFVTRITAGSHYVNYVYGRSRLQQGVSVFAAFKILLTFLVACAAGFAAIAESGHPLLFGCLSAAFVVGIVGSEGYRWYRNNSVRSSIPR
jgi:hypothetical protein